LPLGWRTAGIGWQPLAAWQTQSPTGTELTLLDSEGRPLLDGPSFRFPAQPGRRRRQCCRRRAFDPARQAR
jgi:hypothetical protein